MVAEAAGNLDPSGATSHKWLIRLALMRGTNGEVLDSSIVKRRVCPPPGRFFFRRSGDPWVVARDVVEGRHDPDDGLDFCPYWPQRLFSHIGICVRGRLIAVLRDRRQF